MHEIKKIIWIDYLRVIATFCVVLLHSAAPLLTQYNELPMEHWWFGNLYDSMVRMCVPIFFMLSGCLLLEKQESLSLFFQKRINKVLVPLLAWSLIFVIWKAFYENSAGITLYSLYSVILSPAYYHLWFLYALIGIYLFLPILRVFVCNSNSKLLTYYLLLWFIAASIIPMGEEISGIESKLDLLSISGYTGFLVLGYYLKDIEITKAKALIAFVAFFISILITAFGTYYLIANNNGEFNGYFYGYLSPNVILMSASFFVIVKYIVDHIALFSNHKATTVLTSLSSASLGIYLIHIMYLYILNKGDFGFVLSGFVGHPALSIPATAFSVFLLSYFTIIVIKAIPILRKITP